MFYVYENWRARGHKAVIHRGSCGFCNHGKGLTTGTRPEHGRWLGPFTTLSAAQAAAWCSGGRIIPHRCL